MQQFFPDTQQIARGVIVGQGSWEAQLETNKQAFALEFVQRAEFVSKYPATLSPAQFVDALYANAAVTPTSTERQAAIDADQALQRVALSRIARGASDRLDGVVGRDRRVRRCVEYGGQRATRTRSTARGRESDATAAGVQPRVRADGVIRLSSPQPRRRARHGLHRLQLLAREAESVQRQLRRGRDGQGIPHVSRIQAALRLLTTAVEWRVRIIAPFKNGKAG